MRRYSRRTFLKLSGLAAAGLAVPAAGFLHRAHAASGENGLRLVQREAFTMGSIVTVSAYAQDVQECAAAIEEAFAEMKRIDTLMSVYQDHSQLSLINRSGHRTAVPVDRRLHEVVGAAQHFYQATGGAFDITIEPLMRLYGFRDDRTGGKFPSDRTIAETLDAVGTNNISRTPDGIALLHSRTQLDLGGIAVGYALDEAAAILRRHGISSAIINHSGDIIAVGAPPGRDGWQVEITDPLFPTRTLTTLTICDEALSTSGNYQITRKLGTRTIGHILDPRTARSAGDKFLSTTVIAPNAVTADALSTGIFVANTNVTPDLLRRLGATRFTGILPHGHNASVVSIAI